MPEIDESVYQQPGAGGARPESQAERFGQGPARPNPYRDESFLARLSRIEEKLELILRRLG